MRDLIHALSPTYQIPSRHRIADDLLDEAYNGLREEVLKELRRTEFLNITVDETTNIRSQRVIVMTITTPAKSWFIHRVEKLLFVQINKRQSRAEQHPKVTQEFLLEQEDNEIERVLQRKQVQDHLSEGSDTSSKFASSPTSSPTPRLVSNPEPNPALDPPADQESDQESDQAPDQAPDQASDQAPDQAPDPIISTSASTCRPTPALISALNSALTSASGSTNPALVSALNSRLNSLLNTTSEPPQSPPKESTPNPSSARPMRARSKRISEWSQGVIDHCEPPSRRRRVDSS
ncbi:hypothetical protein N7476_004824 [Penicillium atrosanguineum]|uniref:DUF4371 domain-containing protein n=1 Tax=Penicillium atrosanguineum TaxID=1132637 RepID=A0A9W9Q1M5_9EURO|nr:hypothetical protein N7526_001881 [Penicillium atrosanguineum]KAJ5318404.1 hypothetical protein N7476_004824 [Penicillium atrosanguineum]